MPPIPTHEEYERAMEEREREILSKAEYIFRTGAEMPTGLSPYMAAKIRLQVARLQQRHRQDIEAAEIQRQYELSQSQPASTSGGKKTRRKTRRKSRMFAKKKSKRRRL